MKPVVMVFLAGALWVSALTLLVLGLANRELAVLRYAAIPDAIAALVFTWLAARAWVRGPK
jgi:hypothetical protein